jgi:SsrA-binding protein
MTTFYQNRKAYHNYEILEVFEAGISLLGSEVKSVKASKCSLEEGYIIISNNKVVLKQVRIEHYEFVFVEIKRNISDTRDRVLLLNKSEIEKLRKATEIKGLTIIPLKLYYKNNKIKLEIGLAKGKKNYDKRNYLKEKQAKIDILREQKNK